MVDNNNQYIPMVHIVDRNKRRERLASRLESVQTVSVTCRTG